MPSTFSIAKQWLREWAWGQERDADSVGLAFQWPSWARLLTALEERTEVARGKAPWSRWLDVPHDLRDPLERLTFRYLPPPRRALADVLDRMPETRNYCARWLPDGVIEIAADKRLLRIGPPLGPRDPWLPHAAEYWWAHLCDRSVAAMVEFVFLYGLAAWRYGALSGRRPYVGRFAQDEDAAWFVTARWLQRLRGLRVCALCGRSERLDPGGRTRGSALAARLGLAARLPYRGTEIVLAPWLCPVCLNALRNLVHGRTPGYAAHPRPRPHQLPAIERTRQFLSETKSAFSQCLRCHTPPFSGCLTSLPLP